MKGTDFAEWSTVVNLRPMAEVINIYFVHRGLGFFGAILDNTNPRPVGYGIVVVDRSRNFGMSHVLAHELCHYLSVTGHPDRDSQGRSRRRDMWTLRRLMFATMPLINAVDALGQPNPPHHHDVGYGARVNGSFLTLKDFRHDIKDSECARMRVRARRPF
jgi:hypothetical protein